MWWRTQVRIERTSTGIASRVANAVTDIKARLGLGLKEVEDVLKTEVVAIQTEVAAIKADIGAQIAAIEQTVESLPKMTAEDFEPDYDAMTAALGPALMQTIGPSISEHVTMAILQFKAQETKGLQEALAAVGIDEAIESMGAEAQAAAIAQMNYGQQAAMKIMSMKPSKKWEKDHPFGTAGFELFKGAQIQLLSALQGTPGPGQSGRVVMESTRFAPGEV